MGKIGKRKHTLHYKQEMQQYIDRLIRDPRPIHNPHNPPQKNRQLLEEEIYTTIISILKKQQQEICYLHKLVEEQLNDGSENIKLNIKDYQQYNCKY